MTETEGSSTPRKAKTHPSLGEELRAEFKGMEFAGMPSHTARLAYRPATHQYQHGLHQADISGSNIFLDQPGRSFSPAFSDDSAFARSLTDSAAGAEPDKNSVDVVAAQRSAETHGNSDHSFAESNAMTEASIESAEITRLRKELLNAHAQLAHITKHASEHQHDPTDASVFHNQIGPSMDTSTTASVRGGLKFDPDIAARPSDDTKFGGSTMGGQRALMEGSMPDYGNQHPQITSTSHSGPGVIGQQDYSDAHGRPIEQRFTPGVTAPNPSLQGMFRRDSHGLAHKASYSKENMPWGFGSPATGFVSAAQPSPSAGTAGAMAGMPMMHPQVSTMGARSLGSSALSPMAPEFTGLPSSNFMQPSPWNTQPREEPQQKYMTMGEIPNYRQMLDRNFVGPYKPFVDRIVYGNDQQSSIALQHKLKVGTTQQKYDAVQAIIEQVKPLMVNRFGNFLVQRCLEHGVPEQVSAICRAIRGNTVNLSMDAFGCHVVQKAFDYAPEEYKALMVHELLCNINETVIHRYACHVWQKLFELNWNGAPPQIMKYVNEALRGMWHEVALGETGSLVVQNIFENCLEEDKRPCINEVLACIDVIAHGQFGNWCIQHICEHGAPADQTRAIDHILRFATEYSIDQYASKVVEKCLKICGTDFLDRYLDSVCESRHDRPRMPLIDIAGDQYGNYLIQYILQSAEPHRREVVASHLRKHMVSLRGSKYGSRVAMFCNNGGFQGRAPATAFGTLDRAPGASRPPYTDPAPWEGRNPRFNRGFDRSFERPNERGFDRSFDRGFPRFDRAFEY